jgi:enamine deaminase RidA (YjgF/YER057c/UK114 family)
MRSGKERLRHGLLKAPGALGRRRTILSVYEKLRALKIELPEATPPVAAFLPFVRIGSLVFLSGHIAKKNGTPWVGRLGSEVTTEQGKEASRGVAIDLIGTLNAAVGDLNLIRRIVKLMALVNSSPVSRSSI